MMYSLTVYANYFHSDPEKCIFKLKFFDISLIYRLSASLHGITTPQSSSQMFVFHETTDLDILFSFLKQDTEYGKLCIIEEPLVIGYTTMGRLIGDLFIEKCYFGEFLMLKIITKTNYF